MKIDAKKTRLIMARKNIRVKDLKQTIPEGTLGGLISGRKGCRPATAGKLAAALGVDVLEIVEPDSI